jgi:predicted ribosome quality control (RQC) complex YloA/Tae2 family protein
LQPIDLTTLTAICAEIRREWLPARLEQAFQRDRHTLFLGLRTLNQRGWLALSWHPQAAHLCIGDPPPKTADTFTFSDQIRHQLRNLALVNITSIAPWERVMDLQFSQRPGDPVLWHLYVEIMGKYSNVILANQDNVIVTAAHQVSAQQSSVRPIQTGNIYEIPPVLTDPTPSLEEPLDRWRERIGLIPDRLKRNLTKTYRGLSSSLVIAMAQDAGLDPDQSTDSLSQTDWEQLFQRWQAWLRALQTESFQPGWTAQGYTVLGWGHTQSVASLQSLIQVYYRDQLNQQNFIQLRNQLSQRLLNLLAKLQLKGKTFRDRLAQSVDADRYREHADLLMANLHQWQPGLTSLVLADFHSGAPTQIRLEPEKNAVQNAQKLYKTHQKLKRAKLAVAPLLGEVEAEIQYLEQVEAAISELTTYQTPDDLEALAEIRDELIQQQYLDAPDYRPPSKEDTTSHPYRYQTPSGFEVLVGRNNRQNDTLTFRTASDYDLWFHSQEIPGSHVLLRLPAGSVAEATDLQFVANLAAHHSRARHSEQVPVVYTKPKHVYKPKGAKPGMVIYKQEQILWGQPQNVQSSLKDQPSHPPG